MLSLWQQQPEHCGACLRREHNAFLETVAGEVAAMTNRQRECMHKQMQLDEASLERVKALEAKAKVRWAQACDNEFDDLDLA